MREISTMPPMDEVRVARNFGLAQAVQLDTALSEGRNWQDGALCAQVGSDVFYPEKGDSGRDAKRVCMSCEVRDECLESALMNGERFGIWGGLSERERRKLEKAI